MELSLIRAVYGRRGEGYDHGMSVTNMRTFGERVAWLLRLAGMSQKQLAQGMGVSEQFLSSLMHGKRRPNVQHLRVAALMLNTSVGFLALATDDPAPPQAEPPEQVNYFCPQADEAAQLIDAMQDDDWRNLALQMVRLLAMHAGAGGEDDNAPAPGVGGRLILGKLIDGLKKSSEANSEIIRRERTRPE